MSVWSVANQKGAVGNTTTAIALAGIAAERVFVGGVIPTPALPMPAAGSAPETHAEPERCEWVIFSLGGQSYALDVHVVREIVRPPLMQAMPHAPASLIGMANLRGAVVAIFDTARLLGIATVAVDANARVIVIELEGDVIGLLVDRVHEILRFDADKAEAPPPVGATSPQVDALLRQPGRLIQRIDPSSLLA